MKRHGRKRAKQLKGFVLNKRNTSLIFAAVFAAIGAYLLIISQASTPSISAEVESASLTAPATLGSDVNASAEKFVQFGAVPETSPIGEAPFAGPGTVGHGADIPGIHSPATLTNHTSTSYTTSRDGEEIKNLNVNGTIRVLHKNVKIENVKARQVSVGGTDYMTASAEIRWSTIGDMNGITLANGGYNATSIGNLTIYRSEIFGAIDLVKQTYGYLKVEESWLHDLYSESSDPGQGGGNSHEDPIQLVPRTAITQVHILRNRFDTKLFGPGASVSKFATSGAAIIQTSGGRTIDDILIQGNRISGDYYRAIYIIRATSTDPLPTNARIIDNMIQRGASAYTSLSSPANVICQGNTNPDGTAINVNGKNC